MSKPIEFTSPVTGNPSTPEERVLRLLTPAEPEPETNQRVMFEEVKLQRPRTLSGFYRAQRKVAKIVVAHPCGSTRNTMFRALSVDGHEVTQLATGEEVVDYITTDVLTGHSTPDLIIASLDLPGWNGYQLMTGLHGTSWDVPIALVVDDDQEFSWATAYRNGARAILEWPMEPTYLCEIVRRILGLSPSLVVRFLAGAQ